MTHSYESHHFLYYILLFGSSIFINKYVLSVLGFTYPTIFQGWQTLVGAVLLRLLRTYNYVANGGCDLDKAGFISLLPTFLFFAAGVVASSKALTVLSIPIFLCLQNTLGAALYLLELAPKFYSGFGIVSFVASIVTLGSAVLAVFLEINMTFSESPYFWMVVSLACMAVQTIHSRMADARYIEMDRLYFCYVFGVVILAPASLYLEEAFDVLRFANASRYDFLVCCVLSGVIGLFLNIVVLKVRVQYHFATVDSLSRLIISVTSLLMFGDATKHTQKALVFANLVAAVFVQPSANVDFNLAAIEIATSDKKIPPQDKEALLSEEV